MSATPHISHEEHHQALVRRLSREITPSRPLWPVSVRLTLWIVMEVGILAWVMSHTTNNFVAKLTHPAYAIEIVFFTTAAIVSAELALKSAIPGRTLSAKEATMVTALVLAGTIVLIIAQPIVTSDPLGDFARNGWRCAIETVKLGTLPWLALWSLVRRGASMSGWLSGLLVGAGALLFSFAVMRIGCPIDEPLHLLTWHLSPALAVIALSTLGGVRWLRFRPRPVYRAAPE
jgi:energy-converting hydrogenase Eha subunit G